MGMANLFSSIRSRIVLLAALNVAVLCSGCLPLGARTELAACRPDDKNGGTLVLKNATSKPVHVVITSEDGDLVRDLDLAAGESSKEEIGANGDYEVRATNARHHELWSKAFTVACGGTTQDTITKPEWQGTKEFELSSGYGIATDVDGNVYVAGRSYDLSLTENLTGPGPKFTGRVDMLVTSYNDSGSKDWAQQLGVNYVITEAHGVATDPAKNVYVVGFTHGGLDGHQLIGSTDAFIASYDFSSAKRWTRQIGVASSDTSATGVAADAAGNIYVVGNTTGSLFDKLIGNANAFVASYDSSGKVERWTHQIGVSPDVTAGGVATDAMGNVYVVGSTSGDLYGKLVGGRDAFVLSYDALGHERWAVQFGATDGLVPWTDTEASGVATDAAGNVYVTGWTNGSVDHAKWGGKVDMFIASYDSSGKNRWTKQLGTASGVTRGYGVATDAFGNIYVTGDTSSSLGDNKLAGREDMFVTSYDGLGKNRWTKQLGSDAVGPDGNGVGVGGTGVATDAEGNVYVGGTADNNVDGNTLPIFHVDLYTFITKYNSLGIKQ